MKLLRRVYNQKGFLLIEHIIVLFIISIVSLVLLATMQLIIGITRNPNYLTQHAVNTITLRIQSEAQNGNTLEPLSNGIRIIMDEDTYVSFIIQNNRLIRRTHNGGQGILHYNVSTMEVEIIKPTLARITLTSTQNNQHTFHISILTLNIPRSKYEN